MLGEVAKNPLAIRKAISQIISGSMLDSIVGRAIHHSLGFDSIELWRDDMTDCVLRLHLWQNRPEPKGSEDIHNHGRHLAILVLCGEYVNEICRVREGRGTLRHYQYVKDDKTHVARMNFVGTAELIDKPGITISRGELYEISPTVLHRIRPTPGLFTASLVLQGPSVRMTSDVYTTRLVTETCRLPPSIPRSEVIEGLNNVWRFSSEGQ
jgi:hypothetical protein